MTWLPVYHAHALGSPLQKPRTPDAKVSLSARSLWLRLVTGILLLGVGYQVTKACELRTKLQGERMRVKLYPVVTARHQELEHDVTKGPPVTFTNCVNKDHIALTFDGTSHTGHIHLSYSRDESPVQWICPHPFCMSLS